jgi:hypothetical protein
VSIHVLNSKFFGEFDVAAQMSHIARLVALEPPRIWLSRPFTVRIAAVATNASGDGKDSQRRDQGRNSVDGH